jgi:hypothetical protein
MTGFSESDVVRQRGRFAQKTQQEPEIRFERPLKKTIAEQQNANRAIADEANASLERGEVPAGGYDSVGCDRSGRITYRRDGQLHNAAGAAVVRANGDLEFYLSGRRDNPYGPAIVNRDGAQLVWYERGLPVDPPPRVIQIAGLIDGAEVGVWDEDYARRTGAAMMNDRSGNGGLEAYDAYATSLRVVRAAEDLTDPSL